MDKLKTILVPVDFSERSVAAAEHAAVLAKRFDSNLIVLHVVPPNAYEATAFEGGSYVVGLPTRDELRASAEARLANVIAQASPDRPVGKLIVFGRPSEEIAKQTHEGEIDLIVMPTHGYGPFRRFILGSVTTKVLHDVECPVLTGAHVPEIPTVDANPYRRIACAVDLTEHSETVIGWASDFAKAYGAELTLIHAVPELVTGTPYGDWYPTDMKDILIQTGRQRAGEMLERVGCKAEVHIASGPPQKVVRDFAADSDTELLVVGRSSEEPTLGRLRTNAYSIIREAPCPVVSI